MTDKGHLKLKSAVMILCEMFIKFSALMRQISLALLLTSGVFFHCMFSFLSFSFSFFPFALETRISIKLYPEPHQFPLSSCLLSILYVPGTPPVAVGSVKTSKALLLSSIECKTTWKLT